MAPGSNPEHNICSSIFFNLNLNCNARRTKISKKRPGFKTSISKSLPSTLAGVLESRSIDLIVQNLMPHNLFTNLSQRSYNKFVDWGRRRSSVEKSQLSLVNRRGQCKLLRIQLTLIDHIGLSLAVWPDLAKFFQIGNNLKLFGNCFWVNWAFGKILILLWKSFNAITPIYCYKWASIVKII